MTALLLSAVCSAKGNGVYKQRRISQSGSIAFPRLLCYYFNDSGGQYRLRQRKKRKRDCGWSRPEGVLFPDERPQERKRT